MKKTILLFTICMLAGMSLIHAQSSNIWRGNDYLMNADWRQNGWGLVAWNATLQNVTNGYWGYDAVDVVADPYNASHKVIRVKFTKDGVTTESGCGLLFAPNLSFLQNSKKACLSYNVLLDSNFEWGTIGGKLPGFYGLNPALGTPNATTCAGPFPIESNRCFSQRISWRTQPMLGYDTSRMFYENIAWMNEDTCQPTWNCNLPYGAGLVMHNATPTSFEAIHGIWCNIKQETMINDSGMSNGYMKVWYNDILVYNEQNLKIVTTDSVNIYGILFHMLFGQGTDLSVGSPITQYGYLSDFVIADNYDSLIAGSLSVVDQSGINANNLAVNVFPNPSKDFATITYTLKGNAKVDIKLFNGIGIEVKSIVNEKQSVGNHSINFETQSLSDGIYFVYLKTDSKIITKKLIIMK